MQRRDYVARPECLTRDGMHSFECSLRDDSFSSRGSVFFDGKESAEVMFVASIRDGGVDVRSASFCMMLNESVGCPVAILIRGSEADFIQRLKLYLEMHPSIVIVISLAVKPVSGLYVGFGNSSFFENEVLYPDSDSVVTKIFRDVAFGFGDSSTFSNLVEGICLDFDASYINAVVDYGYVSEFQSSLSVLTRFTELVGFIKGCLWLRRCDSAYT